VRNNQFENRNIFHTEFTEPTELFLRNEQNSAIIQELESTEFVADFVTTAGAVKTKTENKITLNSNLLIY
jgi:hypothetical protein